MARTKPIRLLPALLLSLLLGGGACRAQDLAGALPAPQVVTLDTGRVKAAGIADDALLRQAISDLMKESGANFVLRQEAIRASSEQADITDLLIARMKGPAGDRPAIKAFTLRLEVLDIPAAKKFGATQDEAAINGAAAKWMRESNANLVVDKQAVVISNTNAIDVTGNVIASVTNKPAQPAPRPLEGQIRLLDRNAVMQYSKAGQDIARRVRAYADAAKQELGQRGAALQAKGQALHEELPKLSPDEKTRRMQAFREEAAAIQKAAKAKDAQLKEAYERARHLVELALEPVMSKMMKEHGIDLVLDTGAVSSAYPGLDVTAEVIGKLDEEVGEVPVTLTGQPASQRAN